MTLSHTYIRQGTHIYFAQHIHRRGRDNGNFPQIKSYSRYILKTYTNSQIKVWPTAAVRASTRWPLNTSCLVRSWLLFSSALECQRLVLDAPRPSMQPIPGFLPSPGASINAVPVPQMPRACGADACPRTEWRELPLNKIISQYKLKTYTN